MKAHGTFNIAMQKFSRAEMKFDIFNQYFEAVYKRILQLLLLFLILIYFIKTKSML